MNIAIIYDQTPYPIRSGDNARIAEMIAILRQNGHQVHLIITAIPRPGIRTRALEHVDFVHIFYQKNFRNYLRVFNSIIDYFLRSIKCPPTEDIISRVLKRKFQFILLDYWQRYPKGLDTFTRQIISRHQLDVVIVEYVWLWPVIKLVPPHVKTILDTHDIQYARCEEYRKIGKSFPLKINMQIESKIFNLFDAIIAIQKKDHELIKKMSTSQVILTGVTGTNVPRRSNYNNFHDHSSQEVRVLFVGGFNEANIHGLKKFIDQVWRPIVKLHDNVRLEVVGNIYRCLLGISDLNELNIDLHGFIEDTNPIYRRADITINPVWIGTGLKIKTVESLNHEVPLLTTSKGVEGLPEAINSACIVVDDIQKMQEKLCVLINSSVERDNIRKASKEFKKRYLNRQESYKELLNWIAE